MKSRTTKEFRKRFRALPVEVQKGAQKAYRLWARNPGHPSLHFKQVHETEPIYSVRVSLDWRAVGLKRENGMVWFWIGPHAEYDRLIG